MRLRLPSLLLLILLPGLAWAQPTAGDVLREAYRAAEAQFEGVDTYIVTTTMEGSMALFDSMKVYARKVETDDGYTFVTEARPFGGMAAMAGRAAPEGTRPASDLLGLNRKLYELFRNTARYEGTETIHGRTAHVVAIDDATALYRAMQPDGPAMDRLQARNARLSFDADTWDLLKTEMEVSVGDGTTDRTVHTVTELQDYRQTGSLRYPSRVVTRTSSPLSDAERQELEQRRRQMEAQLQQLPEAQRRQLEGMLNMSAGMTSGEIEIIMVTKDVQVNVPLPEATGGR
ncbi:MAG: hypothetical protein D6685_18460 [Bacteroidetes bacterium]|nr:MAG: hypothetical protein D6685_18460 [Bacteroidota bacterium]